MTDLVLADLFRLKEQADRHPMRSARGFVNFGPTLIYLRIGRRYIDGQAIICLQLANIGTEPENQNKGHFKRALEQCRQLGLSLFVECVHDAWLRDKLIEYGFRVVREVENFEWDLVNNSVDLTTK